MYKSKYLVLSKSTFLNNIMYVKDSVSSFELARGYTPNICVLPQASLAFNLAQDHLEQGSCHILHIFSRSKHSEAFPPDLFPLILLYTCTINKLKQGHQKREKSCSQSRTSFKYTRTRRISPNISKLCAKIFFLSETQTFFNILIRSKWGFSQELM